LQAAAKSHPLLTGQLEFQNKNKYNKNGENSPHLTVAERPNGGNRRDDAGATKERAKAPGDGQPVM